MLKSVVYKTRMNKFPVLDIIKKASPISHSIAFYVYSYCKVLFPASLWVMAVPMNFAMAIVEDVL